jgi:hypothetical protein
MLCPSLAFGLLSQGSRSHKSFNKIELCNNWRKNIGGDTQTIFAIPSLVNSAGLKKGWFASIEAEFTALLGFGD